MSEVENVQLPSGALLIGDQWVDESSEGRVDQVNPATGKVLSNWVMAGEAEMDAAVRRAREAAPEWRACPPPQRRRILFDIARMLEERIDEFAVIRTLETGTPLKRGKRMSLAAEWFHYYAGWVDKIEGSVPPAYPGTSVDYTVREPYGVVAIIIPWNGPLVSAAMKVAPALAAGNTVVLKPSELGPLATLRFAELCLEAGLPPGVLNVVPGGPAGGAALVSNPDVDKISFTGGGPTARKILSAAAETLTPVVLELGGKSANVIFGDAELDKAVGIGVQAGIVNIAGQACSLPTRMLVHRSVYDEVQRKATEMVGAIKLGDPFDPETTMGPVISEGSCERIMSVIERARSNGEGRVIAGGERLGGDLADGYFIEPTIFADVDNSAPLAQEEIFGPVLSIIPFDSDDEAVELANDTKYGLAGYVFTNDLNRAHRVAGQLEAGYIGINAFPPMSPNSPFGGVKESGFGREGGFAGIEEFLRLKNVFVGLD